MVYQILIAEDDLEILNLLKLYLEANNYCVLSAADGETALDIFEHEEISFVILDIMLPKRNGYEVVKEIRNKSSVPVLIISAKDQEADKILGLNLGADDYITKPFSPLEVVARVQAGLRRCFEMEPVKKNENKMENDQLSVGDICLNFSTMVASKKGKEIYLTPIEFKVLALLMKRPGRVYAKTQLYEAVNGGYYDGDERTMMVHISNLRDKLEDDPKNPEYIKTIRGIGYKFEKQ